MSSSDKLRSPMQSKRKVHCRGLAFLGVLMLAGYFLYAQKLLDYHASTVLDENHLRTKRSFLDYSIGNGKDTKHARRNETLLGKEQSRVYHLIFSTSCSPFQEWQSTTFFYFADKVNQSGKITRILSGCKSDQELQVVLNNFEQRVAPLSPNFAIHATPNFEFTQEHNKYMNKPFGVLHWMETVLGYSSEQISNVHDEAIVILMDPDMMLLKPITHKFDSFPSDFWHDQTTPSYTEVDHGRPIAQHYGFGWYNSIKGHLREVVFGDETSDLPSPVFAMPHTQQTKYNAGPPYLATARDFYRIVSKWTDVAPRLHHVYQHFMAEMHAYAVAAAHVGLPHQLSKKFMISNPSVVDEGWDFLQDVERVDSCRPDTTKYIDRIPYVLHYCQRYALGRWFVGKYKLPTGMLDDCEAPMLRRPPSDVGAELDWFTYANGQEHTNLSNDVMKIKMNAFAMCTMMDGVNEVATSLRQKHCSEINTNYNESYIFIGQEIFDAFLRNPVEAASVREGK